MRELPFPNPTANLVSGGRLSFIFRWLVLRIISVYACGARTLSALERFDAFAAHGFMDSVFALFIRKRKEGGEKVDKHE